MTGPFSSGDPGDPGWFSPKLFLWMLVPPFGISRMQREVRSPLHQLRLLFISFCNALLLIGVVSLVLAGGNDPAHVEPNRAITLGVVAVGVTTLVLPRLFDRPLDCSDDVALMASYRTWWFLRIALAETAALVGFGGFVVTGELWHYPLGAAFTVVGFATAAPTSRNLARLQERLAAQGCGRSLLGVLAREFARP